MNNPAANGLFVLVLGMIVIFLGMIVIVASVSICGKLMNKANGEKKAKPVKEVKAEPAPVVQEQSEEIPTHIKAAIVAAISAYYFDQKSNCDFIVRKIKRF